MARYITADDIVNRAAVECGLTEVALPFASTDPVFRQLVKLLTSVGQELVGMFDWPQFIKEGSIVTTGAPNRYDVPADFLKFVERTGWDSVSNRRMSGSVSPQVWAILTNDTTFSAYIKYREAQNQFWLFPTDTAAGLTLPYEYIRRTWAYNVTTYKDVVDEASDVVEFEPLLVVRLLKLRFLEARGFDSTKAQDQFLLAYETFTGKTSSGPTLSLSSPSIKPLLSEDNIPDTGIGL